MSARKDLKERRNPLLVRAKTSHPSREFDQLVDEKFGYTRTSVNVRLTIYADSPLTRARDTALRCFFNVLPTIIARARARRDTCGVWISSIVKNGDLAQLLQLPAVEKKCSFLESNRNCGGTRADVSTRPFPQRVADMPRKLNRVNFVYYASVGSEELIFQQISKSYIWNESDTSFAALLFFYRSAERFDAPTRYFT